MKIDKVTNTTQVFGDVQRNSVGISAQNMDKIVNMLSSNLYSDPIGSFFREIVSNAWDSHVEAGTDDPVVIRLYPDMVNTTNFSVTIRDFGTGLSPERFEEVYKMMGESTKNDSDDYIGMWGIGRLSALAVSEMCEIVSYYEGTRYIYSMYRNGYGINIDLIATESTFEKNGLSVSVSIENSQKQEVFDAIKNQLLFFDNIYIDDKTTIHPSINSFNTIKIHRYNTFYISSGLSEQKILLGKVAYPLIISNLKGLTEEQMNFMRGFKSKVALRFNIGELMVTPSREAIQYTTQSSLKIYERAVEVSKELNELKFNTLPNNGKIEVQDLRLLYDYDNIVLHNITIPFSYLSIKVNFEGKKVELKDLLQISAKLGRTDFLFRYKVFRGEKTWYENKLRGRTLLFEKLYNYNYKDYKPIEIKYIKYKGEGYFADDWSQIIDKSFLRELFKATKGDRNISKILRRYIVDKVLNAGKFDISGITDEFKNQYTVKKQKVISVEDSNGNKYNFATIDEILNLSDKIVSIPKSEFHYFPQFKDGYLMVKVTKDIHNKLIKKGTIVLGDFLDKHKSLFIVEKQKLSQKISNNYTNRLSYLDIKHELFEEITPHDITYDSWFYSLNQSEIKLLESKDLEWTEPLYELMDVFKNNDLGNSLLIKELERRKWVKNNQLITKNIK